MIKKLLIAALIIAHTPAYSVTLPACTKKKLLGIGKITLGTLGIMNSLLLFRNSLSTSQKIKNDRHNNGAWKIVRKHYFISGAYLLPLSILAIRDGIKDLKVTQQNTNSISG